MRTIHQTWKDDRVPDPPFREEWRQSWVGLNPGWSYKLWTDADIARFIAAEFPRFFPVWCSYPKAIMRADAWRYLALKRFGGLYVDLDFACLKPLAEWLPSAHTFYTADQGDGCWGNSFMWAPAPELPFFDGIENALISRSGSDDVIGSTGPGFLTTYGWQNGLHVALLPTQRVYPLSYRDEGGIRQTANQTLEETAETYPNSGAITFWCHSWKGQRDSVPLLPPEAAVPAPDPPPSIAVIVIGNRENRKLREAARNSWLSDSAGKSKAIFIVSGPPPEDEDDVHEAPEDPQNEDFLPDEVFATVERCPDSEWVFVCREGTYVALDRLEKLADTRHGLISSEHLITANVPSLDAGILMTRAAALFLRSGTALPLASIIPLLDAEGIPWKATHRLGTWGRLAPSRDNDLVSVAGCVADKLTFIHTFLRHEPLRISPAVHQNWRDRLRFYANGVFTTELAGSSGWWSEDEDGVISLDWLDWPAEFLLPLRDVRGMPTGGGIVVDRIEAARMRPALASDSGPAN